MAERKSRVYNSSDDDDDDDEEEEEESEGESDSNDNSISDSSLSGSSSSNDTSHRQNRSSSEETSESEEELCPAARLLICNRRHHVTTTSVQKKSNNGQRSPVRKSSRESKSSSSRKSSTVSNAGTQTFEIDSDDTNNRNHHSPEGSPPRRKKSERKKSKSRKHSAESELHYSQPKQNFQAQTEEFGVQAIEVSQPRSPKNEERHRKQSSVASGRMNSLFMQEKPIKEEEEDEVRYPDDDRPIRGMSNMKVREDTMDGAEAPDNDPPQRRRTLEDISITELSANKTVLPPEYPEDESPLTLLPCVTCGRTFNPSSLDRHRKVCQKITNTSKKKQVFNAHTQRFEVEDSVSPGGGGASTPERDSRGTSPALQKKRKNSRWREKHQEFLRTIRAARGAPEGDADADGPSSLVPSDYVQCPMCGRHFGPKAADRHIEWCKEQSTRLRSNGADAHLVERLKSRTKYVPPKPGHGGWRAPKKTDVISSIPPPSTSTERRISPPPLAPPRRGVSPSPLAQRRGVSPAPLSRQHSSASLGRSAARSVTSILQAVTGSYASPYGQRHSTGGGSHSGYATPSSYSAYGTAAGGPRTPSLTRSGSFSGSGAGQNFVRSASLRVPGSRRTGERKARARDLASDMLASVCLGASPARGEPEGDEAEDFSSRETTLSPPPFTKSLLDSPFELEFDSSTNYDVEKYNSNNYDSNKKDTGVESSYDPYSAAEMQMQALLGPSFGGTGEDGGRGTGLGAAGMGVGNHESFDSNQVNFRKHSTSPPPKDRLASLKMRTPSPGQTRSYRQSSPLSPLVQGGLSPTPSGEFFSEKRFWRRSPSPPISRDRWSSSPKSPSHVWSPTRRSPSREDRLSITSLSGGSRESSRCPTSVSNTSKDVSRTDDSHGKVHSYNPNESTGSGSFRDDRFSPGFTRENRSLLDSRNESRFSSDPPSTVGSFVRENRFGSFGSGTSRMGLSTNTGSSRTFRYGSSGGNSTEQRSEGNGAADVPEVQNSSKEEEGSRSSLKALRLALNGDRRDGLPEVSPRHARKSSASSSDSSLPPLSSSGSSLSPTTPSKVTRESTVGGHDSLVTPRLGLTFSNSALNRESSSVSPSETLQDVISSLNAIGSGTSNSLASRYPSLNSNTSKSSTFSDVKISKYSNLNDLKRVTSADSKMCNPSDGSAPKFCYECGNKYPVTLAKFCCHCGSRRAAVN